jgi:hypothetical protein
MVSGQMRMCGDIFGAARLWRGRLLTTGHLSSRHPVVMGAGDVAWGSRSWGAGTVWGWGGHSGIEFGWSRTGEGSSGGRKKGVV